MKEVCERCFEWDCCGYEFACEPTPLGTTDFCGNCAGCDGLGWCPVIEDGICGDHEACIAFDGIGVQNE